VAASETALFQWDTFDTLLRSPLPLDLLTVTGGRLASVPPPRSGNDVKWLFDLGVSVVVRASENHLPQLAGLAGAFSPRLPGEVHVQLYATPGGTNSYGWHYDFEDVFIVQTAGVKDYYFPDNSVARDTAHVPAGWRGHG
jgi:hypothetical protein